MSLRSRGEGDGREEWYSICSRHPTFDESCSLCQTGRWVNVLEAEADRVLFNANPEEWRRLANMPGNPGRQFLESVFPWLRPRAEGYDE